MVAPVTHPTTLQMQSVQNANSGNGTHAHTSSTNTSSTRTHTRTHTHTTHRATDADGAAAGTTRLPLVLLLDLDGTLIGRVNLLICEYDLHREAARAEGASAAGAAAAAGRALRESFAARLRHGILRPGVRRFVRKLEQLRGDAGATPVELFLYTASDDAWARFLVPCVEAAIGARFNRPLFVRSHCVLVPPAGASGIGGGGGGGGGGDLRKSIAPLLPKLLRSLRPRYPLLLSASDLADRVVLVDNTAGVMADPRENARLLVCPTYDFQHVHDVLGRLNAETLLSRPALVATVLARHGLQPLATQQGQQQQGQGQGQGPNPIRLVATYYQWLGGAIARTARSNELAQRHDAFWDALRKQVVALTRRTPRATLPAPAVAALARSLLAAAG
jgi:hypothetical protein